MMHCWKSCSVNRKYHFFRLFTISSLIALLVFLFIYVVIQTTTSGQLKDNHAITFFIIFILLYPLHKFCHLLPLKSAFAHINMKIEWYFYILPIIQLKVYTPVSKTQYSLALVFPFIIINALLITILFLFPSYRHYIAILLSYHIGLCTPDLKFIKTLLSSPSGAFVEENENGYEILINK
ncbi:DUF3267 domain-containing protein [Lederbergia sp. NSJ-179]|uniref:DUF3267 domain-containing protein n=1 Tax=Lederbergia sp. NSJ-179 TaxID=2931402 RepID=UPI001FD07D1C|nr:DUF3267 domain-containing protein [Lederbergia sp. NSJ-179]MCJ7840422.1 DUF3267 domain-containing protein [Lederbergia sp. NSJ-179]